MQSNFPKIPLFLSITFLLVSSLFFLYFYGEIQNNNQESKLAETNWHIETVRRDETKNLDNLIKSIENDITEIEAHFAQSTDVVPFLDALEALAKQAGVKAEVESVDLSEDKTGLLVGMKMSGDFVNLYAFLTLLENSSYELEFVSVHVEKEVVAENAPKSATTPVWNGSFKMKLLSFIQ